MARRGNLTFIPTATASSGPALMPLDEIPDDIKTECEEIYQNLKENDGRIRVEFDTPAELNRYIKMVDSYCRQRPADLGGAVRFRKSPTRGLPKNVMDFRITDLPTGEEAETSAETPTESEGKPKGKR